MRLIDADALIAEYDRVHVGTPGGARKLIEAAPTIDAVPVVYGRWVCKNKAYGKYECSACGGMDSNCGDYYSSHFVTDQDYCPNCGAKMDAD